MLSEHGFLIAPSTYYERHRQPITAAELEDAHLANALVTLPSRGVERLRRRKLYKAARYS